MSNALYELILQALELLMSNSTNSILLSSMTVHLHPMLLQQLNLSLHYLNNRHSSHIKRTHHPSTLNNILALHFNLLQLISIQHSRLNNMPHLLSSPLGKRLRYYTKLAKKDQKRRGVVERRSMLVAWIVPMQCLLVAQTLI